MGSSRARRHHQFEIPTSHFGINGLMADRPYRKALKPPLRIAPRP